MKQVCGFCEQCFDSNKIKKHCSQRCYFDSKKRDVSITCQICAREFVIAYRFRGKKTCSRECQKALMSLRLTTRVTKQCLTCQKTYTVIQSYKANSKFCSYECFLSTRKTRQPDVKKVCENCQKEFVVTYVKQQRRYCSRVCATSGVHNAYFGKTGSLHPMFGKKSWNNGLSKNTDTRLYDLGKKISENLKKQHNSGTLSHAGEKNPNYGNTSETLTQEKRRNFSKAAIKRILDGVSGLKTGHISGIYHGKKSSVPVHFKSSWELAIMMAWDDDDNIISYCYEPFIVQLNEAKRTVPDFLVTLRDGTSKVIEIKPTAIQRLLSDKLDKTRDVLETMGYAYELVGDSEFELCKAKLGQRFIDELKHY